MSFLGNLSRLVTGRPSRTEIEAALATALAHAGSQNEALAQAAELAPQEASARSLRRLAEEEERLAGEIREALGEAARNVAAPAPAATPPNHWGRLVHHLEIHRNQARQLQEQADRFDRAPDAVALLDRISDAEEGIARELRNLIARADPQAKD